MKNTYRSKRNIAQRLLAGTAWALIAKVIGVGSALLVNAMLARMLSAEAMGAYFLTVSIVMVAGLAASFGLRQTVVRLVAESIAQGLPGRARKTITIAFIITLIGSLVVAGAYYSFVGEWLADSVFDISYLTSAIGLVSFWIVVLAFQAPVAEFFRGLHDIRLAVFLDGVLANVLLALLMLVLFFWKITLEYWLAVMVTMFAAAISLSLGFLFFWRRRPVLRGAGSIQPREVVSISAPLFVTELANYAILQFSLWIVAANLPADEVALYGAAWRLINLIALPLILLNKSVTPMISELNASNAKQSLQYALRGTATLAAIPAFFVLIAYIFYGSEVMGFVYGNSYRDGSVVLIILSVGMLANVWTGSCGQVLAFTGHQRALLVVTVLTGTISIILAIVSVNKLGLIGVAFAVAVSRVLQNISYWILVRRLTGLWTHGTLNPSFFKLALDRVRAKPE